MKLTDLASERLIKIVVGNEERQRVFHVQETLLRHVSKVFAANLNHSHLGNAEAGVLEFEEDAVDAWEVLLHWAMTKALPQESLVLAQAQDKDTAQMHLVQCWNLGDKYGVVDFQDLVMLELLALAASGFISLQAAEEAFTSSPPGSRIRKLMAALIVQSIYRSGTQVVEDFECLEGLPGYTAQLLAAPKVMQSSPPMSMAWLTGTDVGRKSATLKSFVVGEGPVQHWLHADVGRCILP